MMQGNIKWGKEDEKGKKKKNIPTNLYCTRGKIYDHENAEGLGNYLPLPLVVLRSRFLDHP